MVSRYGCGVAPLETQADVRTEVCGPSSRLRPQVVVAGRYRECVKTVNDWVQPAIHNIVQCVLPYTARSVEAMARNVGQQIRNRER